MSDLAMSDYTLIPSLGNLAPDTPDDTVVSRTFYKDDRLSAVYFSFAPGQELTEHTSAYPAVLQILDGRARLTLGEDETVAGPGTWVHMPPHLPHSIYAETAVQMLLLLLR